MVKTFIELHAMKVAVLRKQCEEEGKSKHGTKMELVKRLSPETENYLFLDKKVSELKQMCKNRGWKGYSKQIWAELIVRLQPKSQLKTPKTILPMELVMLIRKQATDMSVKELRLKKQKQTFSEIMLYIERTSSRAFYNVVNSTTFQVLSPKQKTIIHQLIENEVLTKKININKTCKLIKSKLREFGFDVHE